MGIQMGAKFLVITITTIKNLEDMMAFFRTTVVFKMKKASLIAWVATIFLMQGLMAQNTFPSSGNVGIGTTNPAYALTVNGDIAMPGGNVIRNTSGPLYLQTDASESILFRTGGMTMRMSLNSTGTLRIVSLSGTGSRMVVADDNGNLSTQAIPAGGGTSSIAGANTQIQYNDGGVLGASSTFVWNKTPGYLGVGTSSPTATLDVMGSAKISSLGNGSTTRMVVADANGNLSAQAIPSGDPGGAAAGNNGELQFNNGGQFGSSSNLFWNGTLGYLGIGTNTPSYRLTVNGDIAQPGGTVFHNTTGPLYLQTDASEPIIFRTGGSTNRMSLSNTGILKVENLAGTGTRMVVADASGNLTTQAIPSGTGGGSVAGSNGSIQFNNAGAIGASTNLYWNNSLNALGIGTTNTGEFSLAVNGTIGAKRIKVTQTGWADFVFEPGYQLSDLKEVEQFINLNRHLPDVPSAKEITEQGLDVGNGQAILLRKIEELTLYLIQQQKEIEILKSRINNSPVKN